MLEVWNVADGREPRAEQFRPAWGLPGQFGVDDPKAQKPALGGVGASGAAQTTQIPSPYDGGAAAPAGRPGPSRQGNEPAHAWSQSSAGEPSRGGVYAAAAGAAGAGALGGAAAAGGRNAAGARQGAGGPYAPAGERAEPAALEGVENPATGDQRSANRWLSRAKWTYIAAGVFMFLAVLYGVDLVTSLGKVPRGSEVAGVKVGSMDYSDAETKLVDELGPRLTDPIAIRAGAVSTELDPQQVGLSVDWRGTLDRAGEQPLNPFTRLISFFRSKEIGIESRIPDQRLTGYLETLAREADLDPREGAIWYDRADVKSILPRDGQSVRIEDSREAVLAHWLDENGVDLAVDYTPTETDEDQVREVIDKVAEPAVAEPVTLVGSHVNPDGGEPETKDVPLRVNEREQDDDQASPSTTTVKMVDPRGPNAVPVEFPRDRIGEYLTFERNGNRLEPQYNAEAAKGILDPLLSETQTEGRDASFVFSGNSVTVEPAVMGRTVQWGPLLGGLQAGLQDRGPRTVPVSYESQEPELSTEDAEAAGIRERVGEFSIDVSAGSAANEMVSAINGHLVRSGQTANLAELAGTYSGNTGADGVATAFFNAAYEAGMTELQRTSRGVDDDEFPVARDVSAAQATSFKNQQNTGVVIEAFSTGNRITVRLWGTSQYEVRTEEQPRTSVERPGTRRESGEDCRPSAGRDGYTAVATRIVTQGSREVSRDTFRSVYDPVDAIVCAPAPDRGGEGGGNGGNDGGNGGGGDGGGDSPAPAPAPPEVPGLPFPLPEIPGITVP